MSMNETKLVTKVSPLIEGQVPDFIQADHSKFVSFLTSYYQFLESGELKLTLSIDRLRSEVESLEYILEEGGDKIVLEKGAGTTGKFTNSETITGSISKATAKVLVEDTSNGRIFISSNQRFETGETVTGSVSGAVGTVTSYRGNPIQNIQQLLEYANVDNTLFDFLDNFRDQFMNAIPSTLADGVSKRKLLKTIKQLYTAKGTSEGHKTFLRMILNQEAEIYYPEVDMLRVSDGQWNYITSLRVTAQVNSNSDEILNQQITGLISGATAIVVSIVGFSQGTDSISELEIDPNSLNGSFLEGETITAVSTTRDILQKFTVRKIVNNGTILDKGILYTSNEVINLQSTGNTYAEAKVDVVDVGSLKSVYVDDGGSGYRIGDALTFTGGGSHSSTAAGFVGTTGSFLILEDGNNILSEDTTSQSYVPLDIGLESATDPLADKTPVDGNRLLLDRTHTSGTDASHHLIHEISGWNINLDQWSSIDGDQIVLEEGTDPTSNDVISKVYLTDGGNGYSSLPTIGVTSTLGTGAKIISTTDDIGRVLSVKITDPGFNYPIAPEATFYTHLILKDVTNTTFTSGSLLTTNTGSVSSYNNNTQMLSVVLDNSGDILTEDGKDICFEDGDKLTSEGSVLVGETITCAAGGTGKVLVSDTANTKLNVGTVISYPGDYTSYRNKIGESVVRIQDSKYYQQFSYEVRVGAALAEYMDSLKKAVHPSGFLPFGKVSIASQVSAALSIPAGKDVPDFTADTETFTPELASTFENLFTTVFGRRLGTETDGSVFSVEEANLLLEDNQFVLLEDGEKIITTRPNSLEGSSTNLSEGERDVTLKQKTEIVLSMPTTNTSNPNALKNLNIHPFYTSALTIELETQTQVEGSSITFDDTQPDGAGGEDFSDTGIDFSSGNTPGGSLVLDGEYSDLAYETNTLMNTFENIIIEERDRRDQSGPRFDLIGNIRFNEFLTYNNINFVQEDGDRLMQEDGSAAGSGTYGERLISEEHEQTAQLPSSVYSHSLEKVATYHSVIDIGQV